MEIPKIYKVGKRKYEFIKKCNENLFLYEDINTKAKTCFSRFDLKQIKNDRKTGGPQI
ncbi:MAG: hypothetical protein ACI4VC_05035 [Clostridia bacterium]